MADGTDYARLIRDARRRFADISCDSRKVGPGHLFVAVPGVKADGTLFVKDAVERGAAAVLGGTAAAEAARALNIEAVAVDNPRQALAELAAAFYGPAPATIAAITGTNGKTSITVFLREIWSASGRRAASLGTIGAISPAGTKSLNITTPGPVELQRLAAELAQEGVSHLAVEASSHGLDQYRLDGMRFDAVGFTNLTRDHLDYHLSFDAYREAKLRLFADLAKDDAAAIVNADSDQAEPFMAAAKARGLRLIRIGETGEEIRLVERRARLDGQDLRVLHDGREYKVALPLAGAFQAANALQAAGFAIGLGEAPDRVFAALETLKGAPGRLEKVAVAPSGAPVFVDYAHTPDALDIVLQALRPHVSGKLVVVFGCGGDRDAGKRALMGAVAARLADAVIVTDDNPRSEAAALIRSAILGACPDAREIGDRREAIRTGIEMLQAGDILVIAGKGHETGQIVGGKILPFSDREEAVACALSPGGAGSEGQA